nr:G-type lectin S-receptor-like serine/threonine-protein kinase At4g27290 [Ipomoea batatas]
MAAVSNGDTDMGWLCYVLLAFLCFFCNLGGSTDSLRPGESVTPNQTLVSADGNFALGFFRPGNSSSFFLGICMVRALFWESFDGDSDTLMAGDEAKGKQRNRKTERDKDVGVAVMIPVQGNSPGELILKDLPRGYAYYSYATQNDEVYLSYGYTNTSIQASCLNGFKPKSQRDWDKGKYDAGCERIIALGCGEADTFMRLTMMKWPDHSSSLGNMTFQECEMECSKTCSCTAFAYANITSNSAVNCINWFGDLVDLAHNYSPGGFSQDLYVRVHSSELNGSSGNDHSSHKNKRRLLLQIIVASVLCILSYFCFGVYPHLWKESGYIPPEYVLHGQFSEKSDVYSFGVLLLEIVSGQKNSNFIETQLSVTLPGWAWKNWKDGKPLEFIDKAIKESCDSLKLIRYIEVGLLCVQAIPTDRPTMSDVVRMLSNDPSTPIPQLKEPAFVSSNSNSIVCTSHPSSKNEITISIVDPR